LIVHEGAMLVLVEFLADLPALFQLIVLIPPSGLTEADKDYGSQSDNCHTQDGDEPRGAV
jgi:hypothetical protein